MNQIKNLLKKFKQYAKKAIKVMKKSIILSMLPFLVAVFIIGTITVGLLKSVVITAGLLLILFTMNFILNKGKTKKTKPLEEKKSKEKKKVKKKKIFRIIWNLILIGILFLILGITAFIIYIVKNAPEFNPEDLYKKDASIVLASNGEEIAKLGENIRDNVTFDEIPEVLIDAIIATEDSRFFQHNGFDLLRFMKASAYQLMGRSEAGGASTITMQISKNDVLKDQNAKGIKGIVRKFTDIYMSVFVLEKKYSKEEILEFYVNAPFLGASSYGVAEASRNYFGKELKDINLSEAAFLAGLFQAPGYYGDGAWNNPERAEKRRNTVLYLMERHGYINKEEEKIANSIPVSSMLIKRGSSLSPYQWFIDMVATEVTEKTKLSPFEVPMIIETTLDISKQDHLNKIMSGQGYTWINDGVETGVSITNVHTGAILAISGGRNITIKQALNRATKIKRQPGSTAKTVFDFGPGIEYENWSTYTPFLDDVHSYTNGKSIKNWDGKYFGLVTLKEALGLSRNIPSLKAFQSNNNKNIYSFVKSIGLTPEMENGFVHEAHAIGAYTGANPLQMTAAYASFANGGYYIEPYTIKKITFIESGEKKDFAPVKNKVMSDSTAYMITNVLHWSVTNGISGIAGKVPGYQVAVKTGTTNFDDDFIRKLKLPYDVVNDLWAVGYTPDYAVGLWYGYDETTQESVSKKYYSTSADNARKDRLYNAILNGIVAGSNKNFTIPNSVVAVEIEKGTIPGSLPSEFTPQDMRIVEYFKKGTEPTTVSDRYKILPNVTDLKVVEEGNKIKISYKKINTPTYYTDEYMTTFFNKYYGNQSQQYLANHKLDIQNKMGEIIYEIYYKDKDGNLKYITNTKENTITIDRPKDKGNITFIVKTSFSIFKSNASTGTEFGFLNKEIGLVPEWEKTKTLTNKLNKDVLKSEITALVKVKDLSTGLYINTCTINVLDNENNNITFPIRVSVETTFNLKYNIECNGEVIKDTNNGEITQALTIK